MRGKYDYSSGENLREMSFRFVNHTADVQFIVSAPTKARLFQECIRATAHYISGEKKIRGKEKRKISVEGKDDSAKLYALLEEVIYFLDSEGFLATHAVLGIQGNEVKGTLYGVPVRALDGFRHVKAATYADMYIRKQGRAWKAQAVLDV